MWALSPTMTSRRVTSCFAFVLLLTAASASADDRLASAEQVSDAIAQYCIDTGGRADRLEEMLKGVRLRRDQIGMAQEGDGLRMSLRVDGEIEVEINYQRGGNVKFCRVSAYARDAPATFERAKQHFGLKGTFADYEKTDVEIEPLKSPPGTSLVGWASTFKMDTSAASRFTINVLLAPSTN